MTAQQSILAPDTDVIEAHLAHITRRWDELDEPCLLEIAFLTVADKPETRGVRRFRPDQLAEAAEYAAGMTVHKLNAYVTVNPIMASAEIAANKRAAAKHIVASFFHWVDADDGDTMATIRAFGGPAVNFAVITGTRPSPRAHAYWELETPTRNLVAWKATQEFIVATFDTDAVTDASRMMRLAGTISWPKPAKQAKGYVAELTSLRLYDRPTATSEGLAAVFRATAAEATAARSAGKGPHINTGERQGVQVDALVREIREGKPWRERVRSITAHFVAKGLSDATIHLFTDHLTMPGYTVEETRADVQGLVDDARAKGWTPDEPEPEQHQRTSRFRRASDLEGQPIPPREWLVPELIPGRNVTLLSGDGGTGKSLLALQLAVAAASGGRWIGQEVKPGEALFLSAEDEEEELHRRLDDIRQAEGLAWRDLSRLTYRSLAGEDALLAVETKIALAKTALYAELDAAAAEGRELRLIGLDTAADLYGASENDRAKVRQFVGFLRHLALKHRCAVVLLAHPSLAGMASGSGLSGSTAWNASVRSRLYLTRIRDENHEPDPDARLLTTMKANHARTGGEIALRWQEGVFVAEAAPDAPTGLDRMAASAKAERVFLRLLDEFTAQGRRVNHLGAGTYAPKLFAAHPKAEGVTKRAFIGAMEALLSNGALAVQHEGPPSRRVSYLTRAGQ